MQCVILLAGEGTRMRPLTLERPKPLIAITGKPLLDHIVEALPAEVTELVLVIGYKGEMIREYCGDTFYGRPVTYVVQDDPKAGTAKALFAAQGVLHDRFLVMYGDDIHGAAALKKVVGCEHGMLVARAEHPERFGVVEQNEDGTLRRIVEKPVHPVTNLVNIGGYVLTTDIFTCDAEKSLLGEYYLTDNLTVYAHRHPVAVIEQDLWIPVGYPEDIQRADAMLSEMNS